ESDFKELNAHQDVSYEPGAGHRIEGGYTVRRLSESVVRRRFDNVARLFRTTDALDSSLYQSGVYVQDTMTLWNSRMSVTAGARADHVSLTRQTVWMPRVSAAVSPLHSTRMTFAWGQYSQFPDFIQMFGEFRNPSLHAERSSHYVAGVEQ